MYKNLFFDLDGTICDSLPGIVNGIRYAMNKNGINDLSDDKIKEMIGIPLNESLKRFFYDDSDLIQQTITTFRAYYSEKGLYESEPYVGIKDLLKDLTEDRKLFLITAKPTKYAVRMLEYHGIANYFEEIKGFSDDMINFNKSDLITSITVSGNAIMIGDKSQDLTAGKCAGIATCGVTYGYGSISELEECEPDHIVYNVSELTSLLQTTYVSSL